MGRSRRQTCRCGSSMRFVGKSAPSRNGHHASVFYCSDCDAHRLRG